MPIILHQFNVSYLPISLPSEKPRPHIAQDPYMRKDCSRVLGGQLESVFFSGLTAILNAATSSL